MRLIPIFLICAGPAVGDPAFPNKLIGDFTGDGQVDYAEILEENEGEGTLVLTLSDGTTITKPNLVWIGGIGQEPWLKISSHGSLQVFSENSSIGRNRWEQTLTLAYRGGTMKVAGYTFRWHDTLNLDDIGICDLNLLSGKGELVLGQNEKTTPITVNIRVLPVADWPEAMPTECARVYN